MTTVSTGFYHELAQFISNRTTTFSVHLLENFFQGSFVLSVHLEVFQPLGSNFDFINPFFWSPRFSHRY